MTYFLKFFVSFRLSKSYNCFLRHIEYHFFSFVFSPKSTKKLPFLWPHSLTPCPNLLFFLFWKKKREESFLQLEMLNNNVSKDLESISTMGLVLFLVAQRKNEIFVFSNYSSCFFRAKFRVSNQFSRLARNGSNKLMFLVLNQWTKKLPLRSLDWKRLLLCFPTDDFKTLSFETETLDPVL